MSRLLLAQGSLVPILAERAHRALACGALLPIETTEEIVSDGGVDFLVRRASSLVLKDEAKPRSARAAQPVNPFLPHEPDLFVADISDTHMALFNKYSVIERHLLIITRRFVDQEVLLDAEDFTALAACMAQIDGLAFYNGGVVAGASQPHKHLQLVPLPMVKGGPPVTVEPLFAPLEGQHGILRVPGFPFRHALVWMAEDWFSDTDRAARRLHECYRDLFAAIGLQPVAAAGQERQSEPYNLLATRRWMLLVPRSRECFDSVSVNSLGFAGSLFVRDENQMRLVKRIGPMTMLKAVSLPDLTTR